MSLVSLDLILLAVGELFVPVLDYADAGPGCVADGLKDQEAPPERSNRVFIQRFSSQQGGPSRGHGVILPCTATTLLAVGMGATRD